MRLTLADYRSKLLIFPVLSGTNALGAYSAFTNSGKKFKELALPPLKTEHFRDIIRSLGIENPCEAFVEFITFALSGHPRYLRIYLSVLSLYVHKQAKQEKFDERTKERKEGNRKQDEEEKEKEKEGEGNRTEPMQVKDQEEEEKVEKVQARVKPPEKRIKDELSLTEQQKSEHGPLFSPAGFKAFFNGDNDRKPDVWWQLLGRAQTYAIDTAPFYPEIRSKLLREDGKLVPFPSLPFPSFLF